MPESPDPTLPARLEALARKVRSASRAECDDIYRAPCFLSPAAVIAAVDALASDRQYADIRRLPPPRLKPTRSPVVSK
jgi:hypothetical protein